MFDLAELYAAWTEDPQAFWAQPDTTGQDELLELLILQPPSLLNDEVWNQVLTSACASPEDADGNSSAWLDVIISLLRIWSQTAVQANGSSETVEQCREVFEKLLFLARLFLARLDSKLDEVDENQKSTGSTGRQIISLLDAIARTLQSGLSSVFPPTATAQRASLALLYLEPSCRLLQKEITVKDSQLSSEIIRVICLGVKLQHQHSMVRTQILQLLTYYEHAVPIVVEILNILNIQFNHNSLAESVLRRIAEDAAEITDTTSSATTSRAKCINAFITSLCEKMPNVVATNLESISILIGSPVPQLRQSLLDVAVPVIQSIIKPESESQDQGMDVAVNRIRSLMISDLNESTQHDLNDSSGGIENSSMRFKPAFDIVKLVEMRVNDQSFFCRLRAVNALAKLAHEPIFIRQRERFAELAVLKMKDKSQLVRRQAMRLMKRLIETHPEVMHANDLSYKTWSSSLDQIKQNLDQAESDDAQQQLVAAQAFAKFTLRFIKNIDEAMVVAQSLLLSKSKSDILDAIDLLVYADAYNVESSAPGIKSIVHLVWAKADNDEDNVVCKTAVTTYHDLFMTAPPDLDRRRGAQVIANNLINLTLDASPGELTSLERLLVLAVESDLVDPSIVGRLWGLYQTEHPVDIEIRRGAAILLSMLALADRSIACSGIGSVVKIGLSKYGQDDLPLAAYSCTILRRSLDEKESTQRLPASYELFDSIVEFLLLPVSVEKSMQWTSLAKESLAAIASLCDCPPRLYTKIINKYLSCVFGDRAAEFSINHRSQLFAQLLYLVGEVALNLLVYLERSELEFKKRCIEQKQNQVTEDPNEPDKEEELMAGGSGSREDDFQDIIRDIREDSILYSDKAILKPFAEIVVEICKSQLSSEFKESSDDLYVIGATQTLSKFMCVSSKYCAANLPLLVDLMSSHSNNVVRSNFVVALGDVAICFNSLIDDHTSYLYDRLKDDDDRVQRTCIVALTFLILAGQIKVKGKLGEMAKAVIHPNRQIAKLTTMFFRELDTKENAIYRSFLDMLSTLIADELLIESDMLEILKFLAKFITKEKHIKQLTDKLLSRLPRCETERQWKAYVQVIKTMPQKLEDSIKAQIAKGYNPTEIGQDDESDRDQHNDNDDYGENIDNNEVADSDNPASVHQDMPSHVLSHSEGNNQTHRKDNSTQDILAVH